MAQRITEDEVRHAARLARLELSDEDVNRFTRQLAEVLEYMTQIESLDVDGVEPMAHPLDMPNVLRDDEPSEPLSREEALRNAPASGRDVLPGAEGARLKALGAAIAVERKLRGVARSPRALPRRGGFAGRWVRGGLSA